MSVVGSPASQKTPARRPRIWLTALVVCLCLIVALVSVALWSAYSPRERVPLPANGSIRELGVGDTLIYKGSVTRSAAGGKQLSSLTATFSYGPANRGFPPPLRPLHLRIEAVCLFDGISQDAFVAQDSNRNLLLVGGLLPGGQYVSVGTPCVQVRGVLTPSSRWEYTADYSSGSTEHAYYKVVSVEWVRTPMAEFEAYKVEYSREMTGGWSERGVMWTTPRYPEGVKMDYVSSDASGTTMHVVAALSEARTR